jgi:hypothetical protein
MVRQLEFQVAAAGVSPGLDLGCPLSTLVIWKTPKSCADNHLTTLFDRRHATECPRLVWVVRYFCRIAKDLFVK